MGRKNPKLRSRQAAPQRVRAWFPPQHNSV